MGGSSFVLAGTVSLKNESAIRRNAVVRPDASRRGGGWGACVGWVGVGVDVGVAMPVAVRAHVRACVGGFGGWGLGVGV